MCALVLQYYFVLRSVLRAKPQLRRCRTRCRHCGIYFITHPRNAGRKDLGCPFGCREAYRRQRSTERSTKYYQTEAGKLKKSIQNGKRGKGAVKESENRPAEGPVPAGRESSDVPQFDAGMVDHVQMVTSLIEGRKVTREEIKEMLARKMRQHSIAREKRIDYAMRTLKESPP